MDPAGLFHQLQTCVGGIERQQQGEARQALHHQKHDGHIAQACTGRGSRPEDQSQSPEEGNQKQEGKKHLGAIR